MCQCQGRKGDQGVQGIQGATGATGPQGATGPAGSSWTQVVVGSTTIAGSTDVSIVASAAQTADFVYFGQIQLISTTTTVNFTATITPIIAGIAQASKALVIYNVIDPGTNAYNVVPVSDLIAVTATDLIQFRITLDDYTQGTSITFRVNYLYQ